MVYFFSLISPAFERICVESHVSTWMSLPLTGDSLRKLTYGTLDNPKTQLRLLSIEPGEWSAPLRVTLQTSDYEEIEKYTIRGNLVHLGRSDTCSTALY